ncbi:MAG: hypothetical protein JWM10_240 [Myxococcaceae bacterium]|nr:hypothetical protein [Myxococcaceae bacterium]
MFPEVGLSDRARPVEIFVYRYTEKVGRGWRRKLLRNVTAASDVPEVLFTLAFGRYRLEWRDHDRWVCHVQVWEFDENGARRATPRGRRAKARRVPPPTRVERPESRPVGEIRPGVCPQRRS